MINILRRPEISRRFAVCVFVLACLAGFSGHVAAQAQVGRVVIIGVDGMSPAGIRAADTPVMDSLCAGGACTLEARAVLPTKSSPNWASMVTGATPEEHGVTSNAWRRDKRDIQPAVTGLEDIFPTLFGQVREQRPDAVTGLFHEWKGLARLVETTAIDRVQTGLDAEATLDSAAAFLRDGRPDFLFVHLDIVDHVGHEIGHGTPEYVESVEFADTLIGRLRQAAVEAGIDSSITWIVSADHGGVGKGHGGDSPEEVLIPLLMDGRAVRHGVRLDDTVNIYDIAATAALLLGVELPQAAVARPVCGALDHPGCAD